MQRTYRLIVTHYWAHLDEMVGIYLLRQFGQEVFSGIENAEVEYDDAGAQAPESLLGHGEHSALSFGVLPVGVYSQRVTPFNEHCDEDAGQARDKSGNRECAASMVYKYLHLENPRVAKLVEYVRQVDTRGGAPEQSMAEVIKLLNSKHPDNPKMVMAWALAGLEAWLESVQEEIHHLDINFVAGLMSESIRDEWRALGIQALEWKQRTYEEAIAIVESTGVEHTVHTKDGRNLRVLCLETDNPRASYAGTGNRHADLVVVRRPNGQVGIFTRRKSGLQLGDLAAVINVMEQEAGGKVFVSDWHQLRRRGSISGGRWHYPEGMEMLLNGGNSAPCVPATRLSLDDILGAIDVALGLNYFQGDGIRCCGIRCVHSVRMPCDWRRFGLTRCRHVRALQHVTHDGGNTTKPTTSSVGRRKVKAHIAPPPNNPFAVLLQLKKDT